MHRHRPHAAKLSIVLSALIAASLASGVPAAHAGILWVDNVQESVAVPLESPTLGVARARHYIDIGRHERAELALKRVLAKYPHAAEAHRLLASLYRGSGRAELAALHENLARAST